MVSYLQVEGLVKSFGDRVLFENLSLGVGEGQRIGLIAKNGTGKTTLLNIIAGREDYEAGRITFRRDLKVAYLEQNPAFPEGTTVLDACFLADSPALRAVAAYEQAVASADEDVLHRAMAEMDAQDAWNYESRVKQILTQLKIKDFDQPTGQLSGGQVKRVALANALIAEPDLLILDEPTNHLDLEMTEWLEEYLAHTRLSLLMVTHDRYFLDRVCSDIVEIDDRQAYVYHGNYSLYLEKRQQRLDAADAQRERDNNLYRTELEWIRRQPQARGTKARSRVESFGELEERLRKRRESGDVRLDVKAAYIGKKIFEVRGLSKRFGDKVILDGFDYRIDEVKVDGDSATATVVLTCKKFDAFAQALTEATTALAEDGQTAELDADQINEKVGQLVLEALGSVEPTESNPVELPFTRTDNAWGPASGAEQALSTALFSG